MEFIFNNYTGQETQVWLDFALACNYLDDKAQEGLIIKYDHIIGKLVNMSMQPEKWSY